MKILTNDPSITAWGWAVLQFKSGRSRVLDTGCIKTEPEHKKKRIRKSDDTARRLTEICQELLRIQNKHQIDWILSEAPHGSQSSTAAQMIGSVTGIMCCFATCHGIPIEWYSEADAKKCLAGKRSLSKEETLNQIVKIYGDNWCRDVKYKDHAVADALAVFNVGKKSSQALIYAANQIKD